MKKIYMLLFAVLAFAATAGAQTLLIDENFDDWDPTGADGFTSGSYTSWNYTTPSGAAFELRNSRYKIGDSMVDLERDDKDVPGAIIFPEVPTCTKVEIDYRSGNNNSVTGERAIYLATFDATEDVFTKISPDYPAIGRAVFQNPEADEFIAEDALFQTAVNTDEVVSETPIRLAIQGWGSGNLRIENIRVWGAGEPTSLRENNTANIVIYATPKNIKIGGDVTSVEVVNLSGTLIKFSSQQGIQSISTADMPNGIYIVKATDSNGRIKVEKVMIR